MLARKLSRQRAVEVARSIQRYGGCRELQGENQQGDAHEDARD